MGDASVATALQSSARLVVVEAPGGCGKTFQGAEYARKAALALEGGRLLILTHTNAACDVFAARIHGFASRVEIRTLDGLITEIASAYHKPLGLPADVGAWARRHQAYNEVASKVSMLLKLNPFISRCLVQRFPLIICDEHQDASADQHSIIMSLHQTGASLRVFGDPMQQIFGNDKAVDIARSNDRWRDLKSTACIFDELDYPHRWTDGEPELGHWILAARSALREGGQIDLTGSPPRGLTIHYADNISQNPRGFSVARDAGRAIYDRSKMPKMLILTSANDTCTALRAFFNRSYPLWEGHMRDGLSALVAHTKLNQGNSAEIAQGLVGFLGAVATGFTPSDLGKILVNEASTGCVVTRRGKPQLIQSLARHLVNQPDHRGVATALGHLRELIATEAALGGVKIHHMREFAEAIQLGNFDDADDGFAELARRRNHARPKLPDRAISTIHKAKGLEFDNVMLLPCDKKAFSGTAKARAKLYVAISRAKKSLMVVISRNQPSPLFKI